MKTLKQLLKLKGAILGHFNSPINGRELVAIVTGLKGDSQNDKTGEIPQVSILDANVSPTEAVRLGLDESNCGHCVLRPILAKLAGSKTTCYVNKGHAPYAIYKAYKNGSYETINPDQLIQILKTRKLGLRWGAYGDVSMLPFPFVDFINSALIENGLNVLSYTHGWTEDAYKTTFDARHFWWSMASIDAKNTVEKLRERFPQKIDRVNGQVVFGETGHEIRYYRIRNNQLNVLQNNEVNCPSSGDKRHEPKTAREIKKGKGARLVVCDSCNLCGGSQKQAKSISIEKE